MVNKLKGKKDGFTLIELVIVIAIISILTLILFPSISAYVDLAKVSVDKSTLRDLNNATTLYSSTDSSAGKVDVFQGYIDNENRIHLLVNKGYLKEKPVLRQNNAVFDWNIDEQEWKIRVGTKQTGSTSLGSGFTNISKGMAGKIRDNKSSSGSYGSTAGDARYTDVGLDPKEWEAPVDNLYYTPSGENLIISPESGYSIIVKTKDGQSRVVPAGSQLVYNNPSDKWYYPTVGINNEVDVGNMEVKKVN